LTTLRCTQLDILRARKCDMRVAVLYAGDSTGLLDDCLTKTPAYLTLLSVIDVKISLILGNLLISGICSQNPASRLARQISVFAVTYSTSSRDADASNARERLVLGIQHKEDSVWHFGEHSWSANIVGQPFMAMESVDGQTLKRLIAGRSLSPEQIPELR
jgi:hypothetical protein